MIIKMIRQTKTLSLYVVMDDKEKVVGILREKRFITSDEAFGLACRFQKEHPELFEKKTNDL